MYHNQIAYYYKLNVFLFAVHLIFSFQWKNPISPRPIAMIIRHKMVRSVLNVQLKILHDLVTEFSKDKLVDGIWSPFSRNSQVLGESKVGKAI